MRIISTMAVMVMMIYWGGRGRMRVIRLWVRCIILLSMWRGATDRRS